MNYSVSSSLRRFGVFALMATAFLSTASRPVAAQISEKDFSAAMEKYLAGDAGQEKLGSAMEKFFQKKQQEAMKAEQQREEAEIENQFKNPVNMEVGKSPIHGPANAKITIVEFSDFQCPYCKRGADTMTEVMKLYPNDVKVAFKHFPLPFHKEAEPAARASWAAQQQGKFWEYHDILFNNQQKLNSAYYVEVAKELKLDVAKFQKDMDSPEAAAQVKADNELGSKNGIQGTPGFFVNGVAVKGAYPASHFQTIIDRWLKMSAEKK
jgi:protein-disulfide isomerase